VNSSHWLSRAARANPARAAIFEGDRPWVRYGELAARVAGAAAALRASGLAPGDRVALVMKNSPRYLEALYAAWWAGLAAVPINARLHPLEVRYILEHSQARVVFVAGEWCAGISEAVASLDPEPRVVEAGGREWRALLAHAPMPAAEPRPDELAWLFYTSGTTGRPKGASLPIATSRR
jgi:long-chain acyl-CoA synthetase